MTELGPIAQWLNQTFYGFDIAVFQFFAIINCDFCTAIFRMFSSIAEPGFWMAFAVFSLVLTAFKKTRKIGIILFLTCIFSLLVNSLIIKYSVARIRPYNTLQWNQDYWNWYLNAGAVAENEYCFVSGHTSTAFAVGVAMMLYIFKETKKKWLAWVFLVYAVLVGCSRIYFMVHYPTDVIGGIIVGVILAFAAYYFGQFIYNKIEAAIAKRKNKKLQQTENQSFKTHQKRKKLTDYKMFFPVLITVGLLICASAGIYDFGKNFGEGIPKCEHHGEYDCQNYAQFEYDNPQTGKSEGYCKLHYPSE